MSKPARKPPPKNKPLPQAPKKALPPAPKNNNSKPRSNTATSTQTYTFQTNLNGYTTTLNDNNNASRNGTGTGFTYTTTYYTTSSHPWAQPSKPLKKLPNKTQTPPPTSNISYYHSLPNTNTDNNGSNITNTSPHNITNRSGRANTFDTLQSIQKHTKQPSYHNALPLNPTIVNLNMDYSINDEVDLNDNRQGIIRFIGEIAVELNGAIWYGIELKKPQGNNNGTLKGVSYFKCAEKYATFVEKKSIRWLTSSSDIENIDLDSSLRLYINQIVGVKRNGKIKRGQIRFIGPYENNNENIKYGCELLDDMGVHSGVVDGKFYFTCGIYRGIFVNKSDLIHLDMINDDTNSLHNRSTHNVLTAHNLPSFNDRNGDSDDSDASIESDMESVSSVNTLMTVDDDVFDRIQLDERETDMAFTQILNKFKNVERTQPRPSKLEMTIDTSKLLNKDIVLSPIADDEDILPLNSEKGISLDLSETSPIDDHDFNDDDLNEMAAELEKETSQLSNTQYNDHNVIHDNVACDIDDDEYGLNKNKNKKMSIIVGMHTPHDSNNKNEFKLMDPIIDNALLENINENEQQQKTDEDITITPTDTPEMPAMISTDSDMDINNNNINVPSTAALNSLSPLGLTMSNTMSGVGFHSPQISLNLDDDLMHVNAEDSHLKEMPDSPYDVNTTEREFANTAQLIQLGCNNPAKLFKILKAMTIKLFQEDMKYRQLSTKSNRIRKKLLNYDGVDEFLSQLGFREKDNGDRLECPLDQPPLSVLDAAINVCSDFISKCSRRRAVIDTIKRFNPHETSGTGMNEMDLATLKIETEMEEEKSKTPLPMHNNNNDDEMLKTMTPTLCNQPSFAEQEQLAIDKTLDVVYEEKTDENENEEEIENEVLQEEEEDTFKLYDIIASITHEDNRDNSARQIILLCYTTFTDSTQMFNCLDRRFFETENQNEKNNKNKNKIIWVRQTKVISFVQSWMRQYWDEDWANPSALLMDCMHAFFEKIKNKYNLKEKQKRYVKYEKLSDMLDKTMSFQRASSIRNESEYSIDNILNMPSIQGRGDSAHQFDNKTYDFFKLNNTKIARQITLLDMTYFGNIKARECLGQAWKKKNKYDIAHNICQFIDHFNRIAKWVQSRVLLARDAKKRGRMIKKFIKICDQLFILRNFQSLYALYGALHSSAIIRLKKSWHYVPTKHLAKFEEFKVIFSTKRNMANLRKLHRETYPPMIPYTGIFLQDLLSIEEGNKKRKDDGAVNFARLLRLSTVIDSILLHQKTTYKINIDTKLQQLIKIELQLNQNLSEDYIWKLSDKIKKMNFKKINFMKFAK